MIGQLHKTITDITNSMITTSGTINSVTIAYQNGERLSTADNGGFSVIMLHRLNMS